MDYAIETRGLTRKFGKQTAVDGLDLKVPVGSVCGFLGRNGAGKTTTIRLLMNMLDPTAGEVEVLGMDPQKNDIPLKERVGYVSEDPALYDWMKVGEMVWFTGQLHRQWDQQKVEDLLSRFGLDLDQKVKHLSRGMNAQLALALALGHDPELLILDEPATGLDVLVRRDFLESVIQIIQEEGRTVFLSSHLVHEVERVADRVAIIENGRLLASKELEEIKGMVKKVLVHGRNGTADFSGVSGLRKTEGAGDRQLLTVVDFSERTLEEIKSLGGRVVEVIDLSLEDSFIEYVSPHIAGEEG